MEDDDANKFSDLNNSEFKIILNRNDDFSAKIASDDGEDKKAPSFKPPMDEGGMTMLKLDM